METDPINSLITLLDSINPLSDGEKSLLKQHLFIEKISKGERYVEQGKVCKKIGFITSGVLGVLKIDSNDDEYIPYFVYEGHFAVDVNSFFQGIISDENIGALTDCTLVTITKSTYNLFETQISSFSKTMSAIKEKALLEKLRVKNEMIVDDAQTKYKKFLERYPTIIQRIPQSHIALYLGITQYTLSRVKAKK